MLRKSRCQSSEHTSTRWIPQNNLKCSLHHASIEFFAKFLWGTLVQKWFQNTQIAGVGWGFKNDNILDGLLRNFGLVFFSSHIWHTILKVLKVCYAYAEMMNKMSSEKLVSDEYLNHFTYGIYNMTLVKYLVANMEYRTEIEYCICCYLLSCIWLYKQFSENITIVCTPLWGWLVICILVSSTIVS